MELDKVTSIHYVDFAFKEDVELLTDNSMKDGEVKLDIEYYKDFNHINITKETITEDCEYREDECVPGTEDYIYIDNDIDDFVATKNGYDIFINNLKHKKVYNYEKLYKGKLTITANEKQKN